MRKYSRAIDKELQLHTSEIPEGEWDYITRYDYDYYEDPSWKVRTNYWDDPIYEENEETHYDAPTKVYRNDFFVRKDMVAYVRLSYGLPISIRRSRHLPITYNKVDMESFYPMPIRRSRRIDQILSGDEADFSTTLEDYFPKS